MKQYHLLIACDQIYYDSWAVTFLKTLQHHVPWLSLHCHLVNYTDVSKLLNVDYTFEETTFINDEQKLGYLQTVRFLAVANKFKNNESVIVLDCDGLCVKSFTEEQFSCLFEKQYVLQYKPDKRWMAGFVTFKDNNFRQAYATELLKRPVNEWSRGWDQDVMKNMCSEYNFVPLPDEWLIVNKRPGYIDSFFFMGKGSHKIRQKFLELYKMFVKRDLGE